MIHHFWSLSPPWLLCYFSTFPAHPITPIDGHHQVPDHDDLRRMNRRWDRLEQLNWSHMEQCFILARRVGLTSTYWPIYSPPTLFDLEILGVLGVGPTRWWRTKNAATKPPVRPIEGPLLTLYMRRYRLARWIGLTYTFCCTYSTAMVHCRAGSWRSVLEDGHRWEFWGGSLTSLSTQPLILCFGIILWVYGKVSKQSTVEKQLWFVDYGLCGQNFCWWRSNLAPQLEVSVAIVTECSYFPEIPWFSRLPLYMGRWKWLGGREIGLTWHVLGWYVTSGRIGLEMTRPRTLHIELLSFVPCIQNRGHDHAVASQCCIAFDFWWVSSGCCEEWVYFRLYGLFWMGPSARLLEANLADRGSW